MKDREKDKQPEILKNYYSVAGEHKVQSTLETWRNCLKVPEFIEAYKVLNQDIISLSNRFIEQSKQITSTLALLSDKYIKFSELYNEMED